MSCPRLAAGLPVSNLARLHHLAYDSNHPNGLTAYPNRPYVQLFAHRLKRLVDLLVQLLAHGLQFLLHLLPHALRRVLLEVFQDRLEGPRKLLLQRRAEGLPDTGRLSCVLCLPAMTRDGTSGRDWHLLWLYARLGLCPV